MNRRELLKSLPVAVGAVAAASTSEQPQKEATTKFVLEMNGREIAELVVPHIPDVVRRFGGV